jgi:hypothetical protein
LISHSQKPLRTTIHEEYAKRLIYLKDEDPLTKNEKKDKLLDISLEHVHDLNSFLKLIFICNRNDIAYELILHSLKTNPDSVNLKIFETCLEYDEDISM